MHHLVPADLGVALQEISHARLSSYKNFFNPANEPELYGLYCWNDAISSRFMRLIGILEVLLRNRFHVALSCQYWKPGTSIGTVDSNDWFLQLYKPYAAVQNEGDKKIRKKLGTKHNQATATKVIAGMTYGFWPRVLDAQHTVSGAAVPWDTLLPQIVPGHHQRSPTFWKGIPHQDALYARMDLVGDLRNRVAHFEPIWKFGDEKEEARERSGVVPATVNAAPTTVEEMLKRLQKSYRKTTQLLHWLSHSRAAEYSNSENHQALMWLISQSGLDHFKSLQNYREVSLSRLAKTRYLKPRLRLGGFVLVTDRGSRVGRYYAEPC